VGKIAEKSVCRSVVASLSYGSPSKKKTRTVIHAYLMTSGKPCVINVIICVGMRDSYFIQTVNAPTTIRDAKERKFPQSKKEKQLFE